MQVPCDEGVAIHIGPESCAVAREGLGEALTGERIGQPLSPSHTRGGSRVREFRSHGSGRGAVSNDRPYRTSLRAFQLLTDDVDKLSDEAL